MSSKIKVEDVSDTIEKPPSHKMDGKYAILMESNEEEFECWYYFLRVDGNEETLKQLQNQLEQVDWEIIEDLSTFDLELDNPVSAQTAKEMTKVDLNSNSFHRKFDGKLKQIDFEFRKKDGNETKICKVFDMLSFGQIEDYISDEDIDEEDLISGDSTDNESFSESSCSSRSSTPKKVPPSILRERLREKIKEDQNSRKKGTKKEKINVDE
jgi:hypothetical protein